jgi:hypothetical protein
MMATCSSCIGAGHQLRMSYWRILCSRGALRGGASSREGGRRIPPYSLQLRGTSTQRRSAAEI